MADDASGKKARETLERAGATRVRVEIPDMEGSLRGKYTSAAKVLKGKGATLSDVFYVLSIRDDVFESPLTGVPTGFPDVIGMPDWSTLRPVPWERDTCAVVVDMHPENIGAGRAKRLAGGRIGQIVNDHAIAVSNHDPRRQIDGHLASSRHADAVRRRRKAAVDIQHSRDCAPQVRTAAGIAVTKLSNLAPDRHCAPVGARKTFSGKKPRVRRSIVERKQARSGEKDGNIHRRRKPAELRAFAP